MTGSPVAGFAAPGTDRPAVGAFDRPVDAVPWVRSRDDGLSHLDLIAPGIHCAGCIRAIERTLKSVAGVTDARVNLSTRRIAVDWRGPAELGNELVTGVTTLGYEVQPFDAEALAMAERDAIGDSLLRSVAVAGFAAGNVMLLSVAVWSGAEASTRDLFHWISALIALPAIAYAGRPFYRSAIAALAHRRLNMDVPISLAVILASAISIFETAAGGEHAYFDAAVTLVFFLLIGRWLDHLMRARARSSATGLLALQASAATLVDATGARRCVRAGDLRPGNWVAVAAGERIAADGVIIDGESDLDRSMVTGETLPEAIAPGAQVHAGMLNLTAPVRFEVTAASEDTLLASIVRLMETAERGRTRYVKLADRAARIYAPAVHVLAAATFTGWMVLTGDWRGSLFAAISVLIITCPCALGLAVPAVQVVAAGALLRRGVMVKTGEALEKLARIDTVVFDKTGTLTVAEPRLDWDEDADERGVAVAAGLAAESRHPLARALFAAAVERGVMPATVKGVAEHPGRGLEGRCDGVPVRLGARAFVAPNMDEADDGRAEIWFSHGDGAAQRFAFAGAEREDAAEVIGRLERAGCDLRLLSGDREAAVVRLARRVGLNNWLAGQTPADKVAELKRLAGQGRRVLMVGDGINDAPALAAAFVSMSPSSAADVSLAAADLVFTGHRLQPVAGALALAKRADRLIKQNFALALAYNLIAVPVAMAGFATPLVAAIAMSSSSLVVTANALRLRLDRPHRATRAGPAPAGLVVPTTARPGLFR